MSTRVFRLKGQSIGSKVVPKIRTIGATKDDRKGIAY